MCIVFRSKLYLIYIKTSLDDRIPLSDRSFITSYMLGVAGGKSKYDTLLQGGGGGMTNYDV